MRSGIGKKRMPKKKPQALNRKNKSVVAGAAAVVLLFAAAYSAGGYIRSFLLTKYVVEERAAHALLRIAAFGSGAGGGSVQSVTQPPSK